MRRAGALALAALLAWSLAASAGGPLVVGGTFGQSGVPFTWAAGAPVVYRTDPGPLGQLTNGQAVARVQAMFQVWQDVPTSSISFSRAGSLLGTTGYTGGDVDTVAEFNAVSTSCNNAQQSPIIFDAGGNLTTALGLPSSVLGFTQLCALSSAGRIVSAMVVMNGRYLDGNFSNGELSNDGFDAVFIHEFGHFAGLDHSQIRLMGEWEYAPATPTLYPIYVSEEQKTLSPDDVAWISKLYPAAPAYTATYGFVRGTVYFSDGVTPVQGANVIVRRVDDPATPADESFQTAVSAVSGYLFTSNLGQSVTGTNSSGSPFGGRTAGLVGQFEIPAPPGEYTLEVEGIMSAFSGGSSVGPLSPPMALPGAAPEAERVMVAAGAITAVDVVLLRTHPRFDQFESEGPPEGRAAASGVGRRPGEPQ